MSEVLEVKPAIPGPDLTFQVNQTDAKAIGKVSGTFIITRRDHPDLVIPWVGEVTDIKKEG